MVEAFEIELLYKDKPYIFPASFQTYGFSYRLIVDVFGQFVTFEPDEEHNFRALITNPGEYIGKEPDKSLIAEISNALILMFK